MNIISKFKDLKKSKKLKNKNFTIISHNCVGGVIYHDLNLRFDSPTIDLWFMSKEFIKFCENLEHYLNCEVKPVEQNQFDYPLAKLDDITIYCMHYNSFEEFKEKWERRVKRVNYDNLFIMMSERDGCTQEIIKDFNELPYKNKVIFVHKPMPHIKSAHYIPGTETVENGQNCVVPLSNFKNDEERYIDGFDYIKFLNKKSKYNR